MNPFIVYPVIGLTVLLTGCAATGSSSGNDVSTSNIKSLEDKNEVYIGQFAVTFVTKDKGSATSQSPMIRGGGSEYAQSVLVANLKGIPNSTFQAIADQAYRDFVADLEAKGYTVGDSNDLKKVSEWNELEPLATPYTPSGLSNLMSTSSQETLTFAGGPTTLFATPQQPGQITPLPYQLADLSESVGKPVLAVNYAVHFAYFDSDTDYTVNYVEEVPQGGGTSTTLSASVTLGQGIQVISGAVAQFLVGPTGTFSDNGYVQLTSPVIVGGAYGRNEDTTSGSQKAANALSSALGFFSGKSSKTTEISVVANPAYYQYGALKAIDEANNRIAHELQPKK